MSRRSATEGSTSDGIPRSGLLPARACDECRKRKMKCDGGRPCRTCVSRESQCEYNEGDRRRTNGENLGAIRQRLNEMDGLRSRVERIESLLTLLAEKNGIAIPDAPAAHGLAGGNIHIAPSPPREQDEPAGQGGNDFGRLQRVEDTSDTLVQIGPTSLWSYKRSATSPVTPLRFVEVEQHLAPLPGDYEDWTRNLPVTLNIDRATHDRALAFFAAYYSPWCFLVDMPRFYRDLGRCALVRPGDPSYAPPTRTAYYSPLLHSTALYMGIFLNRREWPGLMRAYESVFMEHTAQQMLIECEQSSLSSVRAYNLYAQAIHNLRLLKNDSKIGERHTSTGYIYSGLSISGVHQLGLNVNADAYVARGEMSREERQARDYAYWSIFLQDMSRAFASGRPPLLAHSSAIALPEIDPTIDDMPWLSPTNPASPGGSSCNGQPGQYTKALHHATRLVTIGKAIMETIYFSRREPRHDKRSTKALSDQLERWYADLPLRPAEAVPLPHIIQLHMTYHLLVIYLHRPFYRSGSPADVQKCDAAAYQILQLSQLFQRQHGLEYVHHSAITVMFCAATVFLLQSANGDNPAARGHFRDCIEYLGYAGVTWHEARSSKQILLSLQSEYFPNTSTLSGVSLPLAHLPEQPLAGPSNSGFGMTMQAQAFPEQGSTNIDFGSDLLWSQEDLGRWLSDQSLWNFPDLAAPGQGTNSEPALQDLFPL